MASNPSSTAQGLESDPRNFIYACSICCATFADTYEGHNETVQGLSDGINPKDRLVTKLYLSSCCHVICGEHIEGGGPPFHPAGQKPRAPCPYCVREKGDVTVRDLYSIRGFHKDEYDPQIPPIWFTAPPMSLDGSTKEMEALRFQYLSLARYCAVSYRSRKPLTDALRNAKQQLVTMQSRVAEEHSKAVSLERENQELQAAARRAGEVDELRAEVKRLQHFEQDADQFNADVEAFRRLKADVRDLDIFRKNKAAILQYMKLLPKVIEQNTMMRERLSSLGFAMAVEPIPNHTQLTSDELDEIGGIAEAYTGNERGLQKSSSTHTAGRSAHTSGHPFTSSDRPLKRQRIDSPLPRGMHVDPPSSRDMMPPPSKSLSKMHSVRDLLPTIRKKFSSSRSSPREHRKKNGDVQMYDNGKWQDAAGIYTQDDQFSQKDEMHSEKPYVSGTSPNERTPQASRLHAGQHADASEFSFRASSPVKMNGWRGESDSVQLPTGPSYLHLMEGLSRDNDIELGLKDPRENDSSRYAVKDTIRPPFSTPQNRCQTQQTNGQQRWGLGHAFLHQSPNATPRPNNQQYTSSQDRSNGFFSRAHYDSSVGIATPAPSQPQQPVRQIQNVVSSPFFGRSRHDAPSPSHLRITEQQPSLHHSAVSQSRRYPTSLATAEWREPPSLNGLSFFDTPLDAQNEPIMHKNYRQSSRHMYSHTCGDGDMSHPEPRRNSFVHDTGYNSSIRPAPSQHHQPQFQTRSVHSLSSNRAPPSSIGQLPSSMPPAFSNHSPVRNQAQWETLQNAGVRSSRQTFDRKQSSTLGLVSANRMSRNERRSVKR